MDIGTRLRAALAVVPGLQEGPSAHGDKLAFFARGREVAHLEQADTVDVRVTRGYIRDHRATLKADARVVLRPSASDWLEVRVSTAGDVTFAVELVEAAIAANGQGPRSQSRR